MRPLLRVVLGLVVVLLNVGVGGYDLLPDWAGWGLVLLTLAAWPGTPAVLRGVVGLALVVAAVLWLPGVRAAVDDQGPQLVLAASLPQLVVLVLLLRHLADRAAGTAGPLADTPGVPATEPDPAALGWLRTLAWGPVLLAVLPVVAVAGGGEGFAAGAVLAAGVVMVAVVVTLLTYAGRPWAVVPAAG